MGSRLELWFVSRKERVQRFAEPSLLVAVVPGRSALEKALFSRESISTV
jgi:hypothetical protein